MSKKQIEEIEILKASLAEIYKYADRCLKEMKHQQGRACDRMIENMGLKKEIKRLKKLKGLEDE